MIHQLFFYVLVLFLPVLLGYHTWPVWTQVLGRRIDYLSPTLYLTDILVFLILSFWIFQAKVMATKKEIFFGCVLLCFAGLNTFFSVSPPVSVFAWAKTIELGFLVWYIVKTKPDRNIIMIILSVCIFYSSCIGVLQFFLQHSIGGIFRLLGERTFSAGTPGIAQTTVGNSGLILRAYGTFPHPNVFGGFLAITLPVVLHFYFTYTAKYHSLLRVVGLCVFITGCVALVLTFSRTAWVIFIIGLIFQFKKKAFILPAIVSIIGVVWMAMLPNDESMYIRQELNTSAIEIWKHHVLIGAGMGNFIVALPSFLPTRLIYFLQPVHNIYLLLLSETGIVGAMFTSGLIWILLRKARVNWPVIGLLLVGLVDHYPFTLQQGQLLFAIFIGLLFT